MTTPVPSLLMAPAAAVTVGERGKEARVRVRFEDTPEASLMAVTRAIDLNRLDRGTYLLTVRVEDTAGSVQVERTQTLNVTK